VSQNAQNAISLPLEIVQSLGGHCAVAQKAIAGGFEDLVVIAWWLRMLCLGLWRLRGHCPEAQNAISGPLGISLLGHCAVSQNAQNALYWPLEIARSLRSGLKCHILAFRDFIVQ